ncbi:hypothetical protein [Vibrio phage BX-1]|nr:hypothetical protein [Vibrio phage BX-1]
MGRQTMKQKVRARVYATLKHRNPFIRVTKDGAEFISTWACRMNVSRIVDKLLADPLNYEVVKYYITRHGPDKVTVHLEQGDHDIIRHLNKSGRVVIGYEYDGQTFTHQRDAVFHILIQYGVYTKTSKVHV